MKRKLIFLLLSVTVYFAGISQTVDYNGILKSDRNSIIGNASVQMRVSICRDRTGQHAVYSEWQQVTTGQDGGYRLEIGRGRSATGDINTINWSDGAYFLRIEPDTATEKIHTFLHLVQMRAPTEIIPGNLEGMASADTASDYGTVTIPLTGKGRPKKVTVDLTSAYVNLRYPADTYPVYRHFEWVDEDANGRGNSLALTYSEKTNHAFIENSDKMGEVKLYHIPFQELFINTSTSAVTVRMTKPVPVTNLGQTYALKGPWKMIYLVEW